MEDAGSSPAETSITPEKIMTSLRDKSMDSLLSEVPDDWHVQIAQYPREVRARRGKKTMRWFAYVSSGTIGTKSFRSGLGIDDDYQEALVRAIESFHENVDKEPEKG